MIEETQKRFAFLLLPPLNNKDKDKMCQFQVCESHKRVIVVTWLGLLQVVHMDCRQNLFRKIETPEKNRPQNVKYHEFFEGLSYNPENELIAVSSVKINSKSEKFFENCIYIFKIKEEKLALFGYYNRNYAPVPGRLLYFSA